MAVKLLHENVFNYYAKENYVMMSIYKTCMTKDDLICPEGHSFQISLNNFKKGNRCRECYLINRKFSKLHSEEYIYNKYKEYDYTLISKYINSKYKDKLICPNKHTCEISYSNFKKGHRCRECFFENNTGDNHHNFNPNREEILLNSRLRKTHPKSWIIKNMKDDPKYQEFLLNPNKFTIDHIIPVSIFCKLVIKYNLHETKIRNIINKIDNLQLLTIDSNMEKWNKGSSLFEASNYLIDNGILFEDLK